MASISYQKTIPIRCETEILIAGGGPSGIAAAFAAAGQGRKVLLLEAQSCLGGLGAAGLVGICHLRRRREFFVGWNWTPDFGQSKP